jgi:lipopolysaccharide export system protein LptA
MRSLRAFAAASFAVVVMLAAAPAGAQMQLQPPAGAPDSGAPIEIVARDGIEWDRENMRYIARGAAKVTQGDKTVEGETLTAFYRQPPGGGTQVYRYAASGAVRLTTPTQKAVADSAVYDIDAGVVVLTGRSMKITTPDQEITARDSLEYWEQKQLAVARGNAVVVTADGRRIGADTLAAYFDRRAGGETGRPSAAKPAAGASALPGQGEQALDRVEAFGNVIVTTPTEVAQGEKAVYNAKTGIALLTGAVKLTRGRNQANGDFLELNLGNGLYKLGCRPGTGSSCVRGLFVPEKQGEGAPRR